MTSHRIFLGYLPHYQYQDIPGYSPHYQHQDITQYYLAIYLTINTKTSKLFTSLSIPRHYTEYFLDIYLTISTKILRRIFPGYLPHYQYQDITQNISCHLTHYQYQDIHGYLPHYQYQDITQNFSWIFTSLSVPRHYTEYFLAIYLTINTKTLHRIFPGYLPHHMYHDIT